MSFQEEKRESIKRYMLEKIRQDDAGFVQKTMENFGISVTTVKRYIKECLAAAMIEENLAAASGYSLICSEQMWTYRIDGSLTEDKVFFQDIRPQLKNISKEAYAIWSYVFMEIMNNAIEHSEGQTICCRIRQDYLYTEISVTDDGIGIFRKIRRFLSEQMGVEADVQDAILELYKGKFTTDTSAHSGEGIFFSSKMMREFAIWSEDAVFTYGCYEGEKLVQSHLLSYYARLQRIGTMVVMKLENQTKRKPKEVFDMYAPVEKGFVHTVIPVKEVCPYGEPIARSQARRILYRLEEFEKVEFDFAGVEFMGQGFADEVFRVFQNRHPEIELIVVNANETVSGMVKHVRVNLKQMDGK